MARSVDAVKSGSDQVSRVKLLVHRRAILLLLVGCTPRDNEALQHILQNSFLSEVKRWLEDILNKNVGGVDLMLHLLSSITMLPVSKEMVTSSKLGKNISAIEKHQICIGGLNEKTIKERVSKVKEEWSASVKRLKVSSSS